MRKLNRMAVNPFNLVVVDSKEECWCGICIAGDYTVVNNCSRHGVSYLAVNGNEQADEVEGFNGLHSKILSTLTPEDYD